METLNNSAVLDQIPPPSLSSPDLKDIETRGFVVIRNFLNQNEIDALLKDYKESKTRAQNENYPITYIGPTVMPLLKEKILEYSEAVAKATSTTVDTDQGGVYFSVKKGIQFAWHQDHESFYMNQNHIDYLNFYMVIKKEKPEEANLNVIPFDNLKAKSPEFYEKLVGQGATGYNNQNGETHIHSDEPGSKVGVLPYDIGILAETPYLNAGDLLLFRGDLIHSTQASEFARVALSVRMVNSKTTISLRKMVKGNKFKMVMLLNNRHTFFKIFNAFRQLKVTEATFSELIDKIHKDNSDTPSKYKFILLMLRLRLRFLFSGS